MSGNIRMDNVFLFQAICNKKSLKQEGNEGKEQSLQDGFVFQYKFNSEVFLMDYVFKAKTNIRKIQTLIQNIRIMIQKLQTIWPRFKDNIANLLNNEDGLKQNEKNLLQQVMIEPSIQQVMKSILIVLKRKQHLIQNLFKLKENEQLLQPFDYIFKNGGKRIRLVLAILISNLFAQNLADQVVQIGSFIEMLHTASLIIDDIQDQSKNRRNNPCAHLVFGLDKSINSANLMYFLPLNKILNSNFTLLQKQKILQIYTKEMINCHLGQAEDVYTHKIYSSKDLPTLDQYIRMTSAKTSSLFSMLIEMLAVILKIDKRTTDLLINTMRYVGISFQIADDILNISDDIGKKIKAQDLHEKKFTILIHYLRKNQEFMKLFFIDQKSDEVIERMVDIMQKQKIKEQCKKIAFGYAEKALKQIQKIQCPHSKSSFKAVVRYVVERQK